MKLSDLLEGRYSTTLGDREITFITDDNRKIVPDCIFVCVKGGSFDGHSVAEKALQQGATVVIVERDLGLGELKVPEA